MRLVHSVVNFLQFGAFEELLQLGRGIVQFLALRVGQSDLHDRTHPVLGQHARQTHVDLLLDALQPLGQRGERVDGLFVTQHAGRQLRHAQPDGPGSVTLQFDHVRSARKKPINQSIDKSLNQPIPQSTNPLIPQSTNPLIPQSTNPLIPQSTNPSINQSINRTSK